MNIKPEAAKPRRAGTISTILILTGACLAASPFAGKAEAAEAGALNWGPGAPGTTFGALPPVPGFFLTNVTGYFYGSELHGADGKRIPGLDLDQKGAATVSKIMGVWPIDLDGLRFATQVVVPFSYVDTDFDNIPVQGSAGGLGNIAIVQLSNYNFAGFHNVGASVGYAARTSKFNASKAVNVQNGYSSADAAVHYNYFDPTGLDFGIMAGYHYNNRNPSTDYKSGSQLAVDFKLTYALNDKIRIGGYGGYLAQIEDDKYGSVSLAHSKFKAFNMGPSLTYKFGHVDATVSYQFALYAQNATKSDAAWLSLVMPLYVPKPGP